MSKYSSLVWGLGGGVVFLVMFSDFGSKEKGRTGGGVLSSSNSHGNLEQIFSKSFVSKNSKSRKSKSFREKLTRDETKEALDSIIFTEIELRGVGLPESVSILNNLLQEKGGMAPRVRIDFDVTYRLPEGESWEGLKVPDVRLKNSSLQTVFEYMCGSSCLLYEVHEGLVEFFLIQSIPLFPKDDFQEEIDDPLGVFD